LLLAGVRDALGRDHPFGDLPSRQRPLSVAQDVEGATVALALAELWVGLDAPTDGYALRVVGRFQHLDDGLHRRHVGA
jgi:hypothetical protein